MTMGMDHAQEAFGLPGDKLRAMKVQIACAGEAAAA
jgi:hypothetical protein